MKLESNVSFLAKGMEAVLAKMSSNNPNQITETRQMPTYHQDQFAPSQQSLRSQEQQQEQQQWQMQQQHWQQQQQPLQKSWPTPMETSPIQVKQSQSVMRRNSVHFPGEQ